MGDAIKPIAAYGERGSYTIASLERDIMGKKKRGGPKSPAKGSQADEEVEEQQPQTGNAVDDAVEAQPQTEEPVRATPEPPASESGASAPPSPRMEVPSPARASTSLKDELEAAAVAEEQRKEEEKLELERKRLENQERIRKQLEKAASASAASSSASSSWGSWGSSMWSSVTSSVSSSLSTVTSTVSTLSENLADKVLDIIDDVEEKLGGEASAADKSATPTPTPTPTPTRAPTTPTPAVAVDDEAPGDEIPESTRADSATPSKKREPTLSELLKEAQQKPVAGEQGPESSSSDLLTNVIQAIDLDGSGLREIGHTLVETSAEVLESLGRTALSFLGEERAAAAGSNNAGTGGVPSPAASAPQSPRKLEARPFGFSVAFEDNLGHSHLEALQLLSRGQEKAVLSKLPSVPAARRAKVDTDLKFIKEQLIVDEDEEEREELDAATRTQQFSFHTRHLAELTVTKPVGVQSLAEAREHCVKLVASWQTGTPLPAASDMDAEDEASSDGGASAKEGDGAALKKSTKSQAEIACRQSVSAFSKYAAQYVEVLRRAGELLLLDASNGAAASAEDLKRKTGYLREATLLITDDLVGFAKEMADAVRNLGESESKARAQATITSIFMEVGNADSTLQEAMVLLAPILQSLLFTQ